MTMRKQKCKAPLPRKSNGEGTAESEAETAEDTEVVGGVDEMPTTLQRGDRVNPVAGTGGLEHLVPRWLATEAMAAETAYEEPKESFTDLLLELQSGDASVGKWKRDDPEGGPRPAGSKRDWRVDHKGLLRYRGAVYVPNDRAVRQEIMKINHDDP